MRCCKGRHMVGKKTSLCIMFSMTASFFVAEIVVGYITNSTALVADSFHMLSDVLSLIIGFLAVLFSGRDSKYNTYGWARAEVLGALANAVFLLALCFTIIVSAIQRLVEIETIENPLLVLYVGSAGLVINLIGLLMFHQHSHGHGGHDHHHDHHHNEEALVEEKNLTLERKEDSVQNHGAQLNMKGVFLHVLGDALGSVVVLMSALTIYFAEGEWRFYIDPLMSLVLATIIIFTTWPLLKRSSLILLQTPPSHIKKHDLISELMKIHGIQAIHEFHVWQLSGNVVIASAHVTMHKGDSFNETASKVSKIFHDKGVHSITLQPEYYDCTEGESLCGASTCHYLAGNHMESITNGDMEMTSEALPEKNIHTSTCLLPCVSEKCDEYRCCSSLRERKLAKNNKNTKDKGLPNPCYVDMDLDIDTTQVDNKRSSEKNNGKSTNKRTSIPQCETLERQSSV